jgi:hypothetical protein
VEAREARLIRLQDRGGGVQSGIRSHLRAGRWEVTTAGLDPNLQLIGGDPWGAPDFTGLIVPTASTLSITPVGKPQYQFRYLFMAARAQFHNGEKARLVGLRLYASLFGQNASGQLFERQIENPMWRFPDGNISVHIMQNPKLNRIRRNPLNADSLMYLDSYSPALLYQTLAPYAPPNGGRPWGKTPVHSDLGNIHDLRYPWRDSQIEHELDIPIPMPSDIVAYVSVGQHDTQEFPAPVLTAEQFAAAGEEDQFWSAYENVRYGRIAVSLVFEEDRDDKASVTYSFNDTTGESTFSLTHSEERGR